MALTRGTADATVLSVPVFGILFADARRDEARAAALLETAVSRHITWPWLSGISGIGPVLAGRLLSRLSIHRAPTPASFWSYCGLATVPGIEYRCPACGLRIAGATGLRETPIHLGPDGRKCQPTIAHPSSGSSVRVAQPRPRRGESRGYDATARHACYLIGGSLVRRGGPTRH